MRRQEISEFYQRLYWHDIEAREHLNNRLQTPLAIIVALAGLLGFMLQNYEHKNFNWTTSSFVALAVLASSALVVATTLFVLSGYRHAYNFLPRADTIEAHRLALDSHYSAYPSVPTAASDAFDAFDDYLRDRYIEYSSINTSLNDERSTKLHQTNTAIICTATFLAGAFLVFYFGGLDKNAEDKTVRVLITSPVSIKGEVMSQSKNVPPPPPPPPPARVVRDDGGRNKTPQPPPPQREKK
jgi:hypothetical protein